MSRGDRGGVPPGPPQGRWRARSRRWQRLTAVPELLLPLASLLVPVPDAGWRFVAVHEAVGLRFVHSHGGSGRHYIVESIGSGVAVLDYDGDGALDVYAVQGAPLPGAPSPERPPVNALFRNLGRGRFAAVTGYAWFVGDPRRGAGDTGYGMGSTAGDYDNDGFVDLYVTNWGPNALYRNNGDGTFSEVTAAAGVGDGSWGTSATWADFNGDGFLDLFVVNYLDATLDNHQVCRYGPEQIESYCGPAVYDGAADVLYLSTGDGAFVDASRAAGIANARDGKGLGVQALDDDGDGDVDVFVANDTRPNFLYRNNGDGRFEDVALLLGVAYSAEGRAQAGMGVAWADLDGDGDPDTVLTHFQDDYNTFYRNQGEYYIDDTAAAGLRGPTLGYLGFGVVAFDPDLDGDLDLFFANGHIYDVIEQYDPRARYAQPNQIFRNEGDGRFRDVSMESGPPFREFRVSRGAAAADLDNDGDADLLVSNNNGELELLANGAYGALGSPSAAPEVAGPRHPSITIRLVGRRSPRDGVGARVVCEAGPRRMVRHAGAGYSFLSQGDPRLRCGLGTAGVARVTVEWPSGATDSVAAVPAGSVLVVHEGRGPVAAAPPVPAGVR